MPFQLFLVRGYECAIETEFIEIINERTPSLSFDVLYLRGLGDAIRNK